MISTGATALDRSAASMLLARDLRLERGSRAIISNLSFSVESGQALVVRGSNGAGKTSLLRILAGLTLPDTGYVAWRGETLKALSATCRNAALYLGHTNALKEDFSATENLRDALLIDGLNVTQMAQLSALEKVGLLDRRNLLARRLSQGQKRRMGLARLALSLSHQSCKTLWLLDEPTNALDEQGVSLFTGLISAHLDRGGVACIATHLELNLASPVKELHLDAMAEATQ